MTISWLSICFYYFTYIYKAEVKMKKALACLAMAVSVTGCSSIDVTGVFKDEPKVRDNVLRSNYKTIGNAPAQAWSNQPRESRGKSSQSVNFYARGIMQQLLENMQFVNKTTPIAVADFVFLDSNFDHSPLLGQQLSEALSHEVHKLGIPVVDYRLTDYIRVSPQGSLALSKDYLELSGDIPIRYVLTGTLVESDNRVLVNARVIGIESKAIVASAQSEIPKKLLTSLSSRNVNDGIFN